MATISMFDPLSTEVRSPLIAGLTEACNKLSTALDLGISECVDLPLSPVVGASGKVFIYQAPLGNKLWLSSPKPVIKKNGTEITEDVDGFSINYIGGSVEFDTGSEPNVDTDKLTVSANYVVGNSNAIKDLIAKQDEFSDNVSSFKGNFPDLDTLAQQYPEGKGGDYAIVSNPSGVMIYLWNERTSQWEPNYTGIDLSGYYDSAKVDDLLSGKEDKITPPTPEEGSTEEDYYYSGAKQWVKFDDKVKNVPLTGLDTSAEGIITPDDTLGEALGKLQNQVYDITPDLTGTETPTEALEGSVGQDYTNTSDGSKYHLTEITEDGKYIWKQYQDKLEFDDTPTSGSNNPVTSNGIYESLNDKTDKIIPSVAGNIATLDENGNLVDSGKGLTDVGKKEIQVELTLPTTGWSAYVPPKLTVPVDGVVSDKTKQNIYVAPYPTVENVDIVSAYSIMCTEQGEGTLTFVAIKGVPTLETKFNISVKDV